MTTEPFRPLVSIVIPVFNGANYMRQAIDSALAQTYRHLEIVVVNDGSTDGGETEAIAHSYGDRIRYFSKANGGCGSALNFGIERMRGEYFSWLSHDDLYLPEKIAHQISVLEALPNRETIVLGGWEVVDKDLRTVVTVRPELAHPIRKLNLPLFALLRGLVHGCALLVPAKPFKTIGLFDESLPTTQDYALWFDFMRALPVHFDPRVLIRSRAHAEQGSNSVPGHITECNELWTGFLQRITEQEMVTLEGSKYLFCRRTADFLATTPYSAARDAAEDMARAAISAVKVSVVIPFHNRISWTLEAIESAIAQDHQNIEVLVVDDGSTDDTSAVQEACRRDHRVRLIQQAAAGPATARNLGVKCASGEYLAFLDSDDLFAPEKVTEQLRYMMDQEFAVSHTSYAKMSLEGEILAVVNSGAFSGRVFPRIMASCPIAMPTVMGKTELFRAFRFPEDIHIGEDVCLWIRIASAYAWGGVDKPLSRVRIGAASAAYNKKKQLVGMVNILSFLVYDDFFCQFDRQIRSLFVDAAGLLTGPEQPLPQLPPQQVGNTAIAPVQAAVPVQTKRSLIALTYRSLRNDGFALTARRVLRRLGIQARQ